MAYTGKHVFHYTKFESALRIIASKSLKFGRFENMNDIAEAKRDVYGMIPADIINAELANYQSISLTMDKSSHRGFKIDPLWGHYAQGGNGVCLVFDKDRLSQKVKEQFGTNATIAPIQYSSQHSNAVFTEGNSKGALEKYIEDNLKDIFFTKSLDWEYEQELRILIKEDDLNERFICWDDALIAVILCLPKVYDYKGTPEFKILKSMLADVPILRYTTSLGNKKLINEEGEKVCGIQVLFE